MEKIRHEILRATGETYNLPIFLEENFDDMGVMVGFDGEIEQIEQKCNFTYTTSGYTIRVYNSVNTNSLPYIINANFNIDWGDSTSGDTISAPNIGDVDLPYVEHTYTGSSGYTITITLNSPWEVKEVKKTVTPPFVTSYGYPTDLGTLIFTIPYTEPEVTGQSQTYLQDYRDLTGSTENAEISFIALGKSRLEEFKIYGDDIEYSGITVTTGYTGYTIDGLQYRDYSDGYTYISGTTDQYYMDEIYNGMITRNEHFLGFIDEPIIYSDVFVDRGKLGVMEKNFRLSEIESVGELEIYGNGYFNVIKD